MTFQFLKNVKTDPGKEKISIDNFLDDIKNEKYKKSLEIIRNPATKPQQIISEKQKIPGILPHFFFSGGRKKENAKHSTGYLFLDIEPISEKDARENKMYPSKREGAKRLIFKQEENILAIFSSTSLKGFVAVYKIPNSTTWDEYNLFIKHFDKYYRDKYNWLGVDHLAAQVPRFYSSDPNLLRRDGVKTIELPKKNAPDALESFDKITKELNSSYNDDETRLKIKDIADFCQKAQTNIWKNGRGGDHKETLVLAFVLRDLFQDYDEALALYLKMTEFITDKGDRIERRLKEFSHTWRSTISQGATAGTIIHLAKEIGWQPSRELIQQVVIDFGQFTEISVANKFINLHIDKFRFVIENQEWYYYDTKRWVIDNKGELNKYLSKYFKQVLNDGARIAATIEDEKQRNQLLRTVNSYSQNSKRKNVLSLLKEDYRFLISIEQFDKQTNLLNLENGTLNLNNFELQDHNYSDYISKIAPTYYDPNIPYSNNWYEFLNKIFSNDKEMIRAVQQRVGLSLLGDIKEQKIFFIYGLGANGKTVLIQTLGNILGDYAGKINAEVVMKQKMASADFSAIAGTKGLRLISTSEVDSRAVFNVPVLKDFSGGEEISTRFLFGKYFKFTPQLSLWMYGNHTPYVGDMDKGLWRRFEFFKLEHDFTKDPEAKPVSEVLKMFLDESAQILKWAVDGLEDYYENGLYTPAKLQTDTEDYKNESDVLHEYLNEYMITLEDKKIELSVAYQHYVDLAEINKEKPFKKTLFSKMLKERGFKIDRSNHNKIFVFGLAKREL